VLLADVTGGCYWRVLLAGVTGRCYWPVIPAELPPGRLTGQVYLSTISCCARLQGDVPFDTIFSHRLIAKQTALTGRWTDSICLKKRNFHEKKTKADFHVYYVAVCRLGKAITVDLGKLPSSSLPITGCLCSLNNLLPVVGRHPISRDYHGNYTLTSISDPKYALSCRVALRRDVSCRVALRRVVSCRVASCRVVSSILTV